MTDTISRLRELCATLNPGDILDEESGVTREDIDAAIEALERMADMVVLPRLA